MKLTREQMVEFRDITLNGNPARISGHRNDYATVTDLTTGLSCEFSWQAVERILNRMGEFKS